MGLFDPHSQETYNLANWFSEAALFLGNRVNIYVPVTNEENAQGDPMPVFASYYQANGIFDVRPNRRTLDAYGWYAEDPDAQPILMYLPEYDTKGNPISIIQRTRIELETDIAPGNATKYFDVYKYLTTSIPGFWWVCWIVPSRDIIPPYRSSDSRQDFNYIRFSG